MCVSSTFHELMFSLFTGKPQSGALQGRGPRACLVLPLCGVLLSVLSDI